jgi:hypothetical protein
MNEVGNGVAVAVEALLDDLDVVSSASWSGAM